MIKSVVFISNIYDLDTVLINYKKNDQNSGFLIYPDFELIHIEGTKYLLIIKG